MVANDDPLDNFVTIWRWDNFAFVQKILLNGTDPYAVPFNTADGAKKNAANGIEQCKFNPRNKSFYIAVPATQTNSITAFGAITAGSGYTPGTYSNVPLTDVTGTGTGATANIIVTTAGGSIATLGKVTGGTGYTATTPPVTTYNGVALTNTAPTSGLGSGATANITVTSGIVATFGAITPGTGYANGSNVAVPLTGGTGTGATANITVANGGVLTQGAITGGSGYTAGTYNGVALTTTGAGVGATANITVAGGAVTTVTIVNEGSGYAVGDLLSAAAANIGGTGTGFSTPVATVTSNGITSVTLASGGSGYTVGDALTAMIGPGGSGFQVLVATVNGAVTAVTLVNPGANYVAGDTFTASSASIGGTGSGFKVPVSTLGGGGTTVTVVNGGSGYNVGDILTASATNLGGTGSGFKVAVLAVNVSPTNGDGFVLKISLPVQSTPTSIPSTPAQHAKVVAAYEIFPGSTGCGVTGVGGGPAGLSIGPSLNGTNTNGLIALGCGAGGGKSLIIDDSGNTILPVPLPAGTDETWYDPVSNHFFFAQSGTGPATGWLGVVNANEYPPRSYIQEDGNNTTGAPVQDTTVPAATGSHSVAVLPGTCNLPSTVPTRLSRVFVPFRSTLSTPNNGSTFCSTTLGAFTPTGPAPQWPGGPAQAPTATTYDQWGCIAVYTAAAAMCSSTGHANPSP
jgi:hypothetical protein